MPRVGLVGPVSVQSDWVGYHVYLRHGTSVRWHLKTQLESGTVTADLTTTVIHSSKLLINDIKPNHSLIQILPPVKFNKTFFQNIVQIR